MYPKTNLTPGMSGPEVKQLQQFLISQGYSIPAGATGNYGDQTKAAVAAWQRSNGVAAGNDYGYWGPKSISAATTQIDRALPIGGTRASPPAPTQPTRTQQPAPTPDVDKTIADIERYINDIVDSVVASGKTINPNITPQELAAIDPAVFLQQAENSIADEYKGKFQTIKDSLTRTLGNIGYDLNLKKQETQRKYESDLEMGQEELAGRGLAFSGNRIKFEGKLSDQMQRDQTAAEVAATRGVQEAASGAEEKIGTEQVRGLNFGDFQNKIQLGSVPVTGSLTSERQYLKESMAKELEKQERERRAYATRSLSFS